METYTSSRGRPEASPAAPPAGLPDGMPAGPAGPGGLPAGLEALAAAVAGLATVDPACEADAMLATGVLGMRRLLDQAEGAWLRLVAAADARGAPGAERGVVAPTAGWLRAGCRMSPALAAQRVRTARALHRGPLPTVGEALAAGELSYQHAAALADATHDLPPAKVAEADPVFADAARTLDPPRLRRVAEHLRDLVDPDAADERTRKRLGKRGLWLSSTFDGMVDVKGLLEPEAGEAAMAVLAPLARPAGPDDGRTAPQRRADALGELARWALRAGDLPQEGGLRPNLNVTVDWDSLQAQLGGWGGVLPGETVRRLACDATITRAVVRRQPDHGRASLAAAGHGGSCVDGTLAAGHGEVGEDGGSLAAVLRAAVSLLPPPLGAPVELLDLGRTTRVVSPALRRALALRDGGCVAEGCGRPAAWCDAHHLVHWVDGGATRLECLVLLCRVHHVAAHEGGWVFVRDPATGRVTLVPPARRGHDPPAA
ncbi:MAG TPA: DUF222 domain-containing protein [Actinomycetes bacterium]